MKAYNRANKLDLLRGLHQFCLGRRASSLPESAINLGLIELRRTDRFLLCFCYCEWNVFFIVPLIFAFHLFLISSVAYSDNEFEDFSSFLFIYLFIYLLLNFSFCIRLPPCSRVEWKRGIFKALKVEVAPVKHKPDRPSNGDKPV